MAGRHKLQYALISLLILIFTITWIINLRKTYVLWQSEQPLRLRLATEALPPLWRPPAGIKLPVQNVMKIPENPLFRIVLCAKVGAESPYLLEWIEFHRLQGIAKFVLFVDDDPADIHLRKSVDQVQAVKFIYDVKEGNPDLIDIWPMSGILATHQRSRYERLHSEEGPTMVNHRLGQQAALKICYDQYRDAAEWLLHIDVDEYLFAPNHRSLDEFFSSLYRPLQYPIPQPLQTFAYSYQNSNISGIYVDVAVFGPDGSATDLSNRIVADPISGEIHPAFSLEDAAAAAAGEQHDMLENFFEHMSTSGLSVRDLLLKPSAMASLLKGMKANHEVSEFRKFPLLIERQTLRVPSQTVGDDYTEVAKKILKSFPVCNDYLSKVLNHSNHEVRRNDGVRDKELGPPPHSVCVPGHLPQFITSMGKSLTWTGRRYDPPKDFVKDPKDQRGASLQKKSRIGLKPRRRWSQQFQTKDDSNMWKSGKTRSCQLPWVHFCSHRAVAPWQRANPVKELRLDHHVFRSLENRYLIMPKWRREAAASRLSQSEQSDLEVLDFASSLKDEQKIRFVDLVRERVQALRPQPTSTRTLIFEDNGTLMPSKFQSVLKCRSLDALLKREQFMCPASHPLVGSYRTHVNPPHALIPRSYCTTAESLPSAQVIRTSLSTTLGGSDRIPGAFKDDIMSDLYRQSLIGPSEHIRLNSSILSPGWPWASACDFDQKLWDDFKSTIDLQGHHVWMIAAYNQTRLDVKPHLQRVFLEDMGLTS